MKLENFKSGVWKRQYPYKSFSPAPVNQEWVWEDANINALLEQATRALGELSAFSLLVPDVDLFIEMHILKEANTSSRIGAPRKTPHFDPSAGSGLSANGSLQINRFRSC